MQLLRPLSLMESYCRARSIPHFPYTFKFLTKSDCSNWLKFRFQQPLIGRFKQTNVSSHAPTARVMASLPARFSSYILLLFPKYLLNFTSLTSFLRHFLYGH